VDWTRVPDGYAGPKTGTKLTAYDTVGDSIDKSTATTSGGKLVIGGGATQFTVAEELAVKETQRQWNLFETLVRSRCGNRAAAEQQALKPIKIGFLAPLTGVGAADGPLMVKGFQLYLDQIGNKMAGHPVEFKVEDDEGHVNSAVAKAKKLIDQDHINVLSGVL